MVSSFCIVAIGSCGISCLFVSTYCNANEHIEIAIAITDNDTEIYNLKYEVKIMVVRHDDLLNCFYPETSPHNQVIFDKVYDTIKNTLVSNKLSISEIRYLFRSILNSFEMDMPVNGDVKY